MNKNYDKSFNHKKNKWDSLNKKLIEAKKKQENKSI